MLFTLLLTRLKLTLMRYLHTATIMLFLMITLVLSLQQEKLMMVQETEKGLTQLIFLMGEFNMSTITPVMSMAM